MFELELTSLEERSLQPFEHIRKRADSLLANIEEIEDDKVEFFELEQVLTELQAELADVRARLGNTLVPAIDDQLFYTLTGFRDLDQKPDPRAVYLSEGEFSQYRYLSELQAGRQYRDGTTFKRVYRHRSQLDRASQGTV